jgi:hypothetical protein
MLTRKEIEKLKARAKGIKRNPYEHVNVSLRTLDIVIAACSAAIIILFIISVSRQLS